jgi:hypothetical protein
MLLLRRILFPQLSALPLARHDAALAEAGRMPFDVIELLGIAFGLVLTVAMTRYALDDAGVGERFAAAALNFAVAVPLLVLLVGPFLVRRVRRGLDTEVGRQAGG